MAAADGIMLVALTREVSSSLADCQLTFRQRESINVGLARIQHARYEEALALAGCRIRRLKPLPDQPDAVFVEDTAIVLHEAAVIARPGAVSRRLETPSVANVLESYRPVRFIDPPATLEGGDVLRMGRTLFVGLSSRTNEDGARQLAQILIPHGYVVRTLTVSKCLHLKSAVTAVDENTVLLNPDWIDPAVFDGLNVIEVDPDEPQAANVLGIGDVLIYPAELPGTQLRLKAHGCRLLPVEMSELSKAEGTVTCGSIILEVQRSAAVAA